MYKKNKIILFVVLTVFFSFLIFIAKNYFFWWFQKIENDYIEQNYIEPTVKDDKEINNGNFLVDNNVEKKVEEKILDNLNSAKKQKIHYSFIPQSFLDESWSFDYYDMYNSFLEREYIYSKIDKLNVILYKNSWEVRWNMRNATVRLYSLSEILKSEYLSVWIHEFAHYIDLYYFENSFWSDISEDFYDISWLSTRIIKSWQEQKDFVSGYAMTNKYEDFAESFNYYVLHNSDFLEKAKSSDSLKAKYDFFKNELFLNNEFVTSSYKKTKIVKDYYRDTTKIDFSLENFLHYLKK